MGTTDIDITGYNILGMLGIGGMAEVYLAVQGSLNRKVAIKVLLSNDDPSFNQRFINEGHLIASLHHPAIITIYDINQLNDGRYYLAMEYVGDGDLTQHQGKVIPPAQALHWIRQLAAGLQVVHEKGLVHRDIKPANILFRNQNSVVITDFGIAKDLQIDSELTQHGIVVGSPSYSSPEQAQCHPIDQRTDIYSLGVVLLEMLTGNNPFRADNYTQTAINHVQMPVPALPNELRKYQLLIDKMLAKNPQQRFSSCQELLDAMNGLNDVTQQLPSTGFQQPLGLQAMTKRLKPGSSLLRASIAILLVLGILFATNYPAISRQITLYQYLYKADRAIAANQLINPAEDNADYYYHQALLIDPDNTSAKAGLDRVLKARVAEALTTAEKHFSNQRLLKPKGDNAVFYFRQALALEPGNPLALDGLHRIATLYLQMSQEAYDKGDSSAGSKYIISGLKAEPGNTALQQMRSEHPASSAARGPSSTTTEKTKNPLKSLWEKVKAL